MFSGDKRHDDDSTFVRQITNIPSGNVLPLPKAAAANAQNDSLLVDEIKSEIRRVVPQLNDSRYKGQSGKVAIVGGCLEYSSAPYFAALAALRAGADLSHVFCSHSAAQVIKGYSPDISVHPCLHESPYDSPPLSAVQILELATRAADEVEAWFSRLDCLLVGPGLGRDPIMLETGRIIIMKARAASMPLILDADAIFLVAREPELITGYPNCIVTPNLTEYRKLAAILGVSLHTPGSDRSSKLMEVCSELHGPTIISKGPTDAICDKSVTIMCTSNAAARRCGHQGHVLAGCLATMLAWTHIFVNDASQEAEEVLPEINPMILAAYGGCLLTRNAAAYAFSQQKRSTVASDIVNAIGRAVEMLFDNSVTTARDAMTED